jgi:hypothetical protein
LAWLLLTAGLAYCLFMPLLSLAYALYVSLVVRFWREAGELPIAELLQLWVNYLPWALGLGAVGTGGLYWLEKAGRKIGEDFVYQRGGFINPRPISLGKPGKKWRRTIVGREDRREE